MDSFLSLISYFKYMAFDVAFVKQMAIEFGRTIDGAVADFKWFLTVAFEFKVIVSVGLTVNGQFSCPVQVVFSDLIERFNDFIVLVRGLVAG